MSPKFSIVIPTRNRAGLLRHALATALAQTHDDYEVVVSDNASADDTRSVAEAVGDPRVRYVRSDTPLSNAGSWEFAVGHAEGEWVTVLGDDDGFVPSLLDRVEHRLESEALVVGWKTAFYVHPDTDPPWPVEAERNVLTVHPFSGEAITVEAEDQLQRLFARREIEPIPSLRDCFVHHSLLDELRRSGGVFGAPDPHWANAVRLLTSIASYAVVDVPLGIMGCSTVQIGGNFLTNRRGHDLTREFDTTDLFQRVPLQTRTCVNVVAETLMRAKDRYPGRLGSHDLDRVRYFVGAREELSGARRVDDGGAALAEWRRVLGAQPPAVRRSVRRRWRRRATTEHLRKLARGLPGWSRLRHRVGGHPARFRVVEGSEHGFASLDGAARHLDGLLPALRQPMSS